MNDDFPRCHYCDRYAFEISYMDLPVCEECITELSKQTTWHLIRDCTGEIWVTSSTELTEYEVLNQGSFKDMWKLCHEIDNSNND